MNTIKTLDVPSLQQAIKHKTVIQTFDDLLPGEAFIIHNDHDPKPLYHELMRKKGDIFTFDYLENGPAIWRVLVKKKPLPTDENI
ncbi:DUF2249 domain-containing protein [Chitinophaga sp. S165]|uniref:DUF2249 domain-containing protein n=1 Tax=Chitinophaga sp. S165 TaxID=2135462 RepID=UPI000D71BA71|nr:DUF2249 domain-containing protein [Chitinophaga sp. S165]PWV51484.1 uncharacterized protein (DUF2249 family) [Chitinophaga sp. S165]